MSIELSPNILKEFNIVISESYGINFVDYNFNLLQEKIIIRMEKLNIRDPLEYLDTIKNSKKEITNLVDSLTIHVTSFFRIPKHFQFLREIFLPNIRNNKINKKIRIWSAGCSIGAEPYSIAMEILNFFGAEIHNWDIKIIASDISFKTLLFAKEGIYKNTYLKEIPKEYQNSYITIDKDFFSITSEVQRYITWDYHNMLYDNGYNNFDIILCRNVLYYFTQKAQEQVIQMFHAKLLDNAPLLLGSSEYLAINTQSLFESNKTDKNIFYYRKI